MSTPYVKTALVTKINASAGVTALIGNRIRPQFDTQESEFPESVYNIVGGEGPTKLDGATSLRAYTVQIDCWALTETEAAAVAKAIRDVLAPQNGAWRDTSIGVHGCFWIDSTEGVNENRYRYNGDTYTIWFRPVP